MFLIIAELPHTYFLLSVVLCSILCWFSLFYGHHLWLCFSITILALILPLLLCWCSQPAAENLQATSTKFSECRTGQRHTQHIPEAELKLLSFWARWQIVCILGDSFGPFSLSPSMCREQRIKGAVFSFLEKKRISAFLRCLWFSG